MFYQKLALISPVRRHGGARQLDDHGSQQDIIMLGQDLIAAGPPPVQNDGAVQSEILHILRKLRPFQAIGFDKIRAGGLQDGGYVLLDDFKGVDIALSFDIADEVSFDLAIADRGLAVHQFDHTVDDPRPLDPRLHFNKKMIHDRASEGVETLDRLVRLHDAGRPKPNILLKIDIEAFEWAVFDAVEPATLSRISQIVGEFHAFEWMPYPQWRARCLRAITKLTDQFALIHVHGNNHAATTLNSGVFLPNVMEFTLVNRAHYALLPSRETFPTALDRPCNSDRVDIHLGAFNY